jgi:hypothetical protein
MSRPITFDGLTRDGECPATIAHSGVFVTDATHLTYLVGERNCGRCGRLVRLVRRLDAETGRPTTAWQYDPHGPVTA